MGRGGNGRLLANAMTAFGLLLTAAPAHAQPVALPLSQLLPELILREITLAPPPSGVSHVAHFSPFESGELTNPAVAIVQGFNNLALAQLSTFPLGSSTGGFTYTFDPDVGTFQRTSASFGPAFAERAATIGRHKLSAGVNYQHTSFDTFEGEDLGDGSIKFYLRHEDCCTLGDPQGNVVGFRRRADGTLLWPPFEGDIIETAVALKASTDTASFVANYGMSDRWDVGIAVPIARVKLEATVRATVLRLVTAGFTVHSFEADADVSEQTLTRQGSATGLGDILLRTKYRLAGAAAGGMAVGLDVRLPTGDRDNLLGAGSTQAKMFLIASRGSDRFAQHINFGYTLVEGSVGTLGVLAEQDADLPDELNYAAGIELVASPRVTIIADIVGRILRDAGRLELASKTFEYFDVSKFDQTFPVGVFPPPSPPPGVAATTQFDEFEARAGNLNLVLGTAGVKFNPVGNLLLSGSVLFPLTTAGLRSRLTTVIGVDYAF